MKDIYKSLSLKFGSDEQYDDFIKTKIKEQQYKKLFKIENEKLIYKPLNLIVVKKEQVNDILKSHYNEYPSSGILSFYKNVTRKYANITRNEVKEFLQTVPEYMLTKNQNYIQSKPIIEKAPNLRWQIDLIDMSMYAKQNKNYNYILNCIDVYSRYCFLRLLKKKDARFISNCTNLLLFCFNKL